MRDVNTTPLTLPPDPDVATLPPAAPAPGTARYKSLDMEECLQQFRLVRKKNQALSERDRSMQYHHRSTVNKHERLRKIMNMLSAEEATPSEVLDFFEEKYGAANVFGYAVTIQSFPEYRHFKQIPAWKSRVLGPLRHAHVTKEKEKASPLQPTHVKELLSKMTHETVLVAFMWISASRYGDLKKLVLLAKVSLPHEFTGLAIDFRGTKGDISGTRGDTKAIIVPNKWLPYIEDLIPSKRGATPATRMITEYRMYKVLKTAHQDLSLHSARNGALQFLAPHVAAEDQAKQSRHGQQYRFALGSLPVYLEGVWFQEERELKQMKMSMILLEAIEEISLSVRLEICQEWLTRENSL